MSEMIHLGDNVQVMRKTLGNGKKVLYIAIDEDYRRKDENGNLHTTGSGNLGVASTLNTNGVLVPGTNLALSLNIWERVNAKAGGKMHQGESLFG